MQRVHFVPQVWALALVSSLATTAFAQNNDIEFKFTNKNLIAASDLHIEFSKQVMGSSTQTPAGTFNNSSGAGTNSMNFANGVGGAGVASLASVTIKFQYQGTAPSIKDLKARWTQNNTTTIPVNNPTWAGWLGNPLRFDEKKNEWAGVFPATGDGALGVTIDDCQYHFHTQAGDSPSMTAARFASFIASLPWGQVVSVSGSSVDYFGRALNDVSSNTGVQVFQQDSTQPVTISDVSPGASTYCTAKINSLGCAPSIVMSGTPSYTNPTPFNVQAINELSQKNGLLFYGFGLASLPFQGGTMCVDPPVQRTPVQWSGGSMPGDNCTGSYSYDFNQRIQAHTDPNLLPGVEVFCQYWSRDPASASTTNLSNAGRFTIQQ